jgi:hypothetical protein
MQLAEKLLDLLGLTDLAAWILHTRDRKFNDRRYALDGSKLHALGGSNGQVSMLLCGRPSIGVEIRSLVWRYRSILTAHPVVKGDHVVQPTGVSVPQTVGHEITAGVLDVFVMEARAGALDGSVMETDAEDVQRKVMAMPTASVPSDGGSQNAGKKRKADRIFFPSRCPFDVW